MRWHVFVAEGNQRAHLINSKKLRAKMSISTACRRSRAAAALAASVCVTTGCFSPVAVREPTSMRAAITVHARLSRMQLRAASPPASPNARAAADEAATVVWNIQGCECAQFAAQFGPAVVG